MARNHTLIIKLTKEENDLKEDLNKLLNETYSGMGLSTFLRSDIIRVMQLKKEELRIKKEGVASVIFK